ncbi:MAG: TIGR00270 family protein [Candidatus Micrarchaeota archaeon]|nr:TIGR00270 family protein [Candidatus Micrarchaeota archaeon]
MPECEICGKRVDTVYEINFEGTRILVCGKDARGRDVINTFGPKSSEERSKPPEPAKAPMQEELIENYGEKIRKAREALGIPVKVLAERISEKESTLTRVEKQETLPSEKTRQKLEKELGIKLLAKSQESKQFIASKKSEPVTLWDLANKDEKDGE